MSDTWSSGLSYDAFVGRWSRRLAPGLVAWAGVPPGARVLDVGCGTGALTEALLATRPSSLVGVDLSPAFVEEARRRHGAAGARFEVADAREIPLPDASVDVAASALVLNFVPEPPRMLREMRRVLAPGGALAVYVWDYAEGGMEMLRRFWDAAVALDPRAAPLDEARRFAHVCAEAPLRRLVEEAGFLDVRTRALVLPTPFAGFEDYWSPFLGGQGPAPTYLASLEPKARDALRDEVRRRLPVRPDGSVLLQARAWAVKGTAS